MAFRSPLMRARPKALAASLLPAAAVLVLIISAPRASHAQSAGRPSTGALVSAFSVLRQPSVAKLPQTIGGAVSHVPSSYALDVSRARRSANTGAWLIPGAGGLCIAMLDSEGVGVSCATAASAERGELAFQEVTSPEQDTTVIGAAPDWIPSVQIRGAAAAPTSVAVKESTYAASDLRAAGPLMGTGAALEAVCGPQPASMLVPEMLLRRKLPKAPLLVGLCGQPRS